MLSPQLALSDGMTRGRYVQQVIGIGSAIALPELRDTAATLYRVKNRGGLGVVAIPEPALDERQLEALARFRFAQYVAAGFIDVEVAYAQRLTSDAPASYRSPDTVHFIVFAAATGQLLASMCMVGAPPAAAGKLIGSRERSLFPVEQQFGWGVYNRLAGVAQTPVERVRDFGRLVKNLRHPAAGPCAVIELIVAATRVLAGPLASAVDVCIGQVEPSRVQRNLEFMHVPLVVLRSGLPCFGPQHPLNRGLEGRDRYPFAFAVADLGPTVARGHVVEAALALPDRAALSALAALNRTCGAPPSSLVPPGGLPALADTPLPQRELSTGERRRLRARGDALARFSAFADLSDSERTTLRALATESAVAAGATLLRRGAVADELILIEAGTVELRGRRSLRRAGADACLGAEGVVNGKASPVNVVAASDLRILRLARDVYRTCLRELPEVEHELQRLAVASRPSLIATNTAETQAALRAAGAAERDVRLRNPDALAARFVSTQPRLQTLAKVRGARRLIPTLAERLAPGGYYYETARVKHVDAILAAELRTGLEQLVILGAGYDSRPYRFADQLLGVRIFEVDLPAMSSLKQRKATRLFPAAAEGVSFVAADFRQPALESALRERGYDLGAATLLVVSGVLPYLPTVAVERLFGFAGRHTSTCSSIVFDYMFRAMVEGDDSAHGARHVRKRLDSLGEPLRFGIPAGGATDFLAPFGLRLDSDVQPLELADRYLRRADGTPAGRPYGFSAIAHARVAS